MKKEIIYVFTIFVLLSGVASAGFFDFLTGNMVISSKTDCESCISSLYYWCKNDASSSNYGNKCYNENIKTACESENGLWLTVAEGCSSTTSAPDYYTCTDTDGQSIFAKGSCSSPGRTRSDECLSLSSIKEAFCNPSQGNVCMDFVTNCPNNYSCENGACVTSSSPRVNGQCGSSSGRSFLTKPSSGLCNIGSASSVNGNGPWYWTCNGTNGGSSASCYASYTFPAVNTTNSTNTTIIKCSANTLNNACSLTKPKFCLNGTLTNKCSSCGCNYGYQCQYENCVIINNTTNTTQSNTTANNTDAGNTSLVQYTTNNTYVYSSLAKPSNNENVIINPDALIEIENCDGCTLNEKCYPFGERMNGTFCSNKGMFLEQINGTNICENNYECATNFCLDGQCLEPGFFQKMIEWFKRLF